MCLPLQSTTYVAETDQYYYGKLIERRNWVVMLACGCDVVDETLIDCAKTTAQIAT
jgi:hypothetical protein